jgi:3-hydroxyacyl-[acyl-carrier-protein] dehydratase
MLDAAAILNFLPHQKPFRFVDEITFVDENKIEGNYTFNEEEFFYKGHFPKQPLTPGVILIECMAQIGLVCFGIYLLQKAGSVIDENRMPLFTSSNIQFYKKVFPGDKVFVSAEKTVFRHGKLRSNVRMKDEASNLICDGNISGMLF